MFPVVFIVMAWEAFLKLVRLTLLTVGHDLIYLSHLSGGFMLTLFYLSIAYFLYVSRTDTKIYPDRGMEIFLPILATFWFLTYTLVELIPATLNPWVLSPSVLAVIVPVGICLNLVGLIVSLSGVFQLNRAFGVVVKINGVVTTGLYNVVRHPIYLGYLVVATGFMLMNPRPFHWLAYGIAVVLQIWRALAEEKKLAQFSPAYREYMKRVPFLFPNVFQHLHKA